MYFIDFNDIRIALKLSKCSDIWTINKTHNKCLAHKLKMRFKLLNFARKAMFNAARNEDNPAPALENLPLRNFFVYSTF
jgi:hypothetical protein